MSAMVGDVRKALPSSFFGFWILMDTSSVWMNLNVTCLYIQVGLGVDTSGYRGYVRKGLPSSFLKILDGSIHLWSVQTFQFLFIVFLQVSSNNKLHTFPFWFFRGSSFFFTGIFDKITLLRRDMSCLAWRLLFFFLCWCWWKQNLFFFPWNWEG
jgi:hypothetical protein